MTKIQSILAGGIVALLLAGCGPTRIEPQSVPEPTAAPAELAEAESAPTGPLLIAVVGDSLTSWDPPYAHDPLRTWVTTANSNGVELIGGWALPGATTSAMLENVQQAATAEVLVIMGGINDIAAGIGFHDRLANIEAIASKVGTERVVLSATAPYNHNPAAATLWNATLREFAARHHWLFIDPWQPIRTPAGTYIDGLTPDGVHPTRPAAAIVGYQVHDALIGLFR